MHSLPGRIGTPTHSGGVRGRTIGVALLVALALVVVAVPAFPLETLAMWLRLKYGTAIVNITSPASGDRTGPSFSLWLRPDTSSETFAGVLADVDNNWYGGWGDDADYDVHANGIEFCRHADHQADRDRLREALRFVGASLATEWSCTGYRPDAGTEFESFAADTLTVRNALQAAGERGPVMLSDSVDWARLSRTLPDVVAAVGGVDSVAFADFSDREVILFVQPTARLAPLSRAARDAAGDRLQVSVRNAYTSDPVLIGLRSVWLRQPGVRSAVFAQDAVTIDCTDGRAAARVATLVASQRPAYRWRVTAGDRRDGDPQLATYLYDTYEDARPRRVERFARLARLRTVTAVRWIEVDGSPPIVDVRSSATDVLPLLPAVRDIAGDAFLDITWAGGGDTGPFLAKPPITIADVSPHSTIDPQTLVDAWNR